MKVIKYIGEYSGAEAASIQFVKGVPTIVQQDSVALSLTEQPDFVLSSIEELQGYGTEAKPAPAPASTPPATVTVIKPAPQEIK